MRHGHGVYSLEKFGFVWHVDMSFLWLEVLCKSEKCFKVSSWKYLPAFLLVAFL